MRPRFLGDANLNRAIIQGLVRRQPKIDFETGDGSDLRGKDDQRVLAIAAEANRILVTHDLHTMPRHFASFLAKNDSSGVILVGQNKEIGAVIEKLQFIWTHHDHESWANRIAYLDEIQIF